MVTDTVTTRPPGDRALVRTAYGLTVVAVSAVSPVAPALPELAASYGVTEAAMAWFQTAVLVPGLVAAPLAMRLTRRISLRRVLIAALILYGVGGVIHVIRMPYALAVALRGLQGVGGSALLPGGFALIGRLEPRSRARAIGANAALLSTMMVLQPLIGSALAAWWLRAPFVVYLSAFILASVLATKSGLAPSAVAAPQQRGRLGQLGLGPVLAATAAVNAFVFGWMLYLSPLLLAQRFSYGVAARGAILATQSVGSAWAALAVRRHVERGREHVLLVAAGVAIVIASVVAATAATPAVAIAGLVTGGAAYGLANPAVLSVASRGLEGATGWWQSSARAGQIMGPLIAASLFASSTMGSAFRAGAVLAAVLVLAGVVLARRDRAEE